MSDTPKPGSREAVAQGCTCPVMDNCHGRGYLGGPHFIMVEGCPLHWPPQVAATDRGGDDATAFLSTLTLARA